MLPVLLLITHINTNLITCTKVYHLAPNCPPYYQFTNCTKCSIWGSVPGRTTLPCMLRFGLKLCTYTNQGPRVYGLQGGKVGIPNYTTVQGPPLRGVTHGGKNNHVVRPTVSWVLGHQFVTTRPVPQLQFGHHPLQV